MPEKALFFGYSSSIGKINGKDTKFHGNHLSKLQEPMCI